MAFTSIDLLHDGNDRPLSLTGKLSHVTSRGLVVLNRGTLVDAWKA